MKSLGGSWKNDSFNLVPLHTAFAMLQLYNAFLEDSAFPQISHFSFSSIPRAFKRSLVGRMFLQALHSRCLILLGQFSRHTTFQIDFIPELFELLPPSPRLDSSFKTFWVTLYPLFSEKLQFVVHAHTIKSLGSLPLMGILSTISASWGRKRFFYLHYIPSPSVSIQQAWHFFHTCLHTNRACHFEGLWGRDPSVLPFMDTFSIFYAPFGTFINHFSGCQHASPHVRGPSTQFSLVEVTILDVFRFEHFMN